MSFKELGWTVIRKAYNVDLLYKYTLKRIYDNDVIVTDEQALGSPSFYKDKEMCKIQIQLLPLMEKETDLKLYPTYTYNRIYLKGAVLKRHSDRPACEISASLHVGGDEWPIWITGSDNRSNRLLLKPGDLLIYKGCDLEHWRTEFEGKACSQAFLHYVDADGPHRDQIFDLEK